MDLELLMAKNDHHKVVIIGSGPAGLTAALYNSRAMLNPVVIDGIEPGGQLMITSDVDNYPGFPDGILGPELMDKMRKQVERFGTTFINGHVEEIDVNKRPFQLTVNDDKILADSVIIASGASANWLGLDSETQLKGKGVSACATCDGFFFKEEEVVVIGGGDTALEEALFLTKFAKKVTIVHRRDQLRASKIMQDKSFANPKIEFIWDSIVEEVLGVTEGKVTGVRLKNIKSGETSKLDCQGFFVAIGHTPNTSLFKGKLEMDVNGYILTKNGTTFTSVPGVFASGDVQDSVYRQAVTAAGTGCMAAIDAEKFLEENGAH